MKKPVIHSDPEILSGTPVFVGTRVPVKNLFDDLEAGDTMGMFLAAFPTVSGEQAVAALELVRDWDRRIEADAASGKLDFLVDEACDEKSKGKLKSL